MLPEDQVPDVVTEKLEDSVALTEEEATERDHEEEAAGIEGEATLNVEDEKISTEEDKHKFKEETEERNDSAAKEVPEDFPYKEHEEEVENIRYVCVFLKAIRINHKQSIILIHS